MEWMRHGLFLLACSALLGASHPGPVTLLRVPQGGIQPQAAVDETGAVHMLYYGGDSLAGDLFYVRSLDGVSFSPPMRVNTHPASAIARGNIRGAHLAIGKDGIVHVAWMGSKSAEPKGPDGQPAMLYTRLNPSRTAFEPERNVIQFAYGLDGGGTVAADAAGHVYVVWHAPEPGTRGEGNRRVWVARSSDNGKSFARERLTWNQPTGVCGCCGIGALADDQGSLYIQYRSATNVMDRDIYLLASKDHGQTFTGAKLDAWKVGACVMSTQALSAGPITAWETEGQIWFSRLNAKPVAAPGQSGKRKHPALASNPQGETMLAWTEGMGYNNGGSLAWQVYDRNGQPKGEAGSAAGVPVSSVVAAFVNPRGGFTIVY